MLNQDRIVKSMFNKLVSTVSEEEAKSRILEKYPELDGELDFILSEENTIKDYTKKLSKKELKKLSKVEDSIESLEDDETELFLSDDEKDPEEVVTKQVKKPSKKNFAKSIVKSIIETPVETPIDDNLTLREKVKIVYKKYISLDAKVILSKVMDELKISKMDAVVYLNVVSNEVV